MPMPQHATDVLILGAGLAGLTAAWAAAREGAKVIIAHPGPASQTASVRAQGGIAAAIGPDDGPAQHAGDTLAVGGGLVDPDAAWFLTSSIPGMVEEILKLGFHPDLLPDGALELGLEAGHSRHRIVHAGGAASGQALWHTLAGAVRHEPAIREFRGARAVELVVMNGRCAGSILMTRGGPVAIQATATILATGGYAGLYDRTAGPITATGSGIAMAYRAGATLADLEFVQFHPTVLEQPGRPPLLLSEALRGDGAYLINAQGERFMIAIHPDAELAPRDIVARAVLSQRRSGPVYLTLGHLDPVNVHTRFQSLSHRLAQRGLNLAADLLPISPAAHFSMGGVLADNDGQTTLPGLFAVGEVACTGLHGANRLASNALGECLVFGTRGGVTAAHSRHPYQASPLPETGREPLQRRVWRSAPIELRTMMSQLAGLERSGDSLGDLLDWLGSHPARSRTPDAWLIGELLARAALARAESRGSHYRIDHPFVDPELRGRFIHRQGEPLGFLPIAERIDQPAYKLRDYQEVIR
ncbi:L-aspartate oxidase (Quinolinate synthetase B) [Nitrolancea hollandica Lb]|uniref:L-aspartate oxidase n=2 Tax=Nitrolancea hollandica TaxID=1206749 RepID=I4ENN9_9BACT|nr:L-aspartate oxidase (Quinolinate synthetase B) [Nitrolancea hollandica Lb]